MANNRMYVVCNICEPKDEGCLNNNDTVFCLGKWYPGGIGKEGAPYFWWGKDESEMGTMFFEFLDKHKHGEVASQYYSKGAGQENPVRLIYESDGFPLLESDSDKKEAG